MTNDLSRLMAGFSPADSLWFTGLESDLNSWDVLRKFGGLSSAKGSETVSHMDSAYRAPTVPLAAPDPQQQIIASPSAKDSSTDEVSPQAQGLIITPPTDPGFGVQWHLQNTSGGVDMNLLPAWQDYSGAGVVVGIVDDGVLYTHPDLAANYRTDLDLDARGGDYDAMAEAGDDHGTLVAGVVAADDDGSGMVGVAPDAQITGFRMGYGADGTLAQELAVLQQIVNVDVANNSWGYNGYFYDDFETPSFAAQGQAIENAAASGRDGLGTVTVFAAGNDGDVGQNVNYHSYSNSPYTIAVGALDSNGNMASFSTPGAAVLVSAPGVDVATIWSDPAYYGIVSGTSFAAPAVSGVVALMLEANPELGYRDVQEILAYSAWDPSSSADGWQTNGADNWNGGGLTVHDGYGFGLVDAHAAVRLAETWTAQSTYANQQSLTMSSAPGEVFAYLAGTSDTITITEDFQIDQVQVHLDIDHTWIGDLSIALTSPDGTTSLLVDQPGVSASSTYGSSQQDINFTFSSVQYWGENGLGDWTLSVNDMAAGDDGILNSWDLTLLGDAYTLDDTYFFTKEWADLGGDTARQTLSDLGGTDTLNFATLTEDLVFDLAAGSWNTLMGQGFQISADSTIENIFGGDGSDTFLGNAADNSLVGMRGYDTLTGGSGDDWIDGGSSDGDVAVFSGTIWDYQISETNGLYRVSGPDGTDQVSGVEWFRFVGPEETQMFSAQEVLNPPPPPQPPQITITGTEGADTLTAGDDPAGYVLDGLDGNDRLNGRDHNDQLFGGAGDDRLYGRDGDDVLTGGSGNDLLVGDAGADTLLGGAGDDKLYIDSDDVLIDGGSGTDWAYVKGTGGVTLDLASSQIENASGGTGNDRFDASGMIDQAKLYGRDGDDVLTGGSGNDLLFGDAGADTLRGGAGDDKLYIDSDDVLIDGGSGTDWAYVKGTGGVTLDLASSQIENASGGTGNDRFDASGMIDQAKLYGRDGDDVLTGGSGNDLLVGDAGADTLLGGAGDDILYGGAGMDLFLFGLGDGFDRIQDFDVGDILKLSGINMDDLSVETKGDDVILSINGTNDKIQIDTPDTTAAQSYSLTQSDDGSIVFALDTLT